MTGGTLRAPGWGGRGERGRAERLRRAQVLAMAVVGQNPLS